MASRIADAEEDRFIFAARLLERVVAPGVPIHRVMGVLQQIRRLLACEAIVKPDFILRRHGGDLVMRRGWVLGAGYRPPGQQRQRTYPGIFEQHAISIRLAGKKASGAFRILLRNAPPRMLSLMSLSA